jgi:antitoxin (DNA-binding transcriptional repressor) of toxin-antitoxin stability system
MKTVTLTELRRNLEGFLTEARQGDIVITKYGKEVGRLIATGNADDTELTTDSTETNSSSVATSV